MDNDEGGEEEQYGGEEPSSAVAKEPSNNAADGGGPKNKNKRRKCSHDCNPVKEPLYDYDTIPVAARLTTKYKGRIDYIKATVERPPGAYPETHLPTWPTMPMEQKIPLVEAPKDTIVISRGRLCKELLRPTKCFNTYDPLNLETIIAPPYDALHDPGAKNYLFKPVVEQTLLRQKLCNNTGQVLCSLKAFNDYRRYLNRAVYIEDVKLAIQNADAARDNQRKQLADIEKERSRTEGKDFRRQQKIDYARKFKEDSIKSNAERLKWKTINEQYLQEAHQNRVDEEHECRRVRGLLKDQIRDERVRNLRITEFNTRAALMKLISEREKNAGKRLREEKKMQQKIKTAALLEKLENKLEAQKKKVKKEAHMDVSLRAAAQKRAEARQRRVESHRAQMPAIIERRKENEIRLWKIVRKYFDRWLAKVRARRARRPDEMHKSLWDIPTVFDGTVAYLRKESGYEKLDDFIMGIVKLKRDIKAEIEAEEAAEREAAEKLAAQQGRPSTEASPPPAGKQDAAPPAAPQAPPAKAPGSPPGQSQPGSPPPPSAPAESEPPSSASTTSQPVP